MKKLFIFGVPDENNESKYLGFYYAFLAADLFEKGNEISDGQDVLVCFDILDEQIAIEKIHVIFDHKTDTIDIALNEYNCGDKELFCDDSGQSVIRFNTPIEDVSGDALATTITLDNVEFFEAEHKSGLENWELIEEETFQLIYD